MGVAAAAVELLETLQVGGGGGEDEFILLELTTAAALPVRGEVAVELEETTAVCKVTIFNTFTVRT